MSKLSKRIELSNIIGQHNTQLDRTSVLIPVAETDILSYAKECLEYWNNFWLNNIFKAKTSSHITNSSGIFGNCRPCVEVPSSKEYLNEWVCVCVFFFSGYKSDRRGSCTRNSRLQTCVRQKLLWHHKRWLPPCGRGYGDGFFPLPPSLSYHLPESQLAGEIRQLIADIIVWSILFFF